MRKLAALFALAMLAFAVLFLREVSLPSGVHQSRLSPDGACAADAFLLHNKNPLFKGPRTSYEFAVRQLAGPVARRAVFYPDQYDRTRDFADLPQIISWSPDSASATFTVRGVTLRLEVDPPSDQPFP